MDQTSENANAWESDQDDVWGDDDNVSYDRAIAEKEWSRLHETFGNVSSPTTSKKKKKKSWKTGAANPDIVCYLEHWH